MNLSEQRKMFKEYKNMIYQMVWKRWNKMRSSRPDVSFDELLSEGYYIYAWCLQNFKNSKNAKFGTYLYIQLKGRLADYYEVTHKSFFCYEDACVSLHTTYSDKESYEQRIPSINYDLKFFDIFEDASDVLSYDGLQVMKYIMSREWEKKITTTPNYVSKPTKFQIARKFGYPPEIVNSILMEIKNFWRQYKTNYS